MDVCLSVFGLQLLAAETDDKPTAESQAAVSSEEEEEEKSETQSEYKDEEREGHTGPEVITSHGLLEIG